MSPEGIIIIGAGGHGKVVLSTILAAGYKVLGFVDDNTSLHHTDIMGHKVLGGTALLNDKAGQSAILAIGQNELRKKFAQIFTHLNWVTAIHPKAIVHDSVILGKGTVVFAGAVIQPDSILGDHVIINTSATVDHDCVIKSFVHVAPGTHLAGNVNVDEGCFIGIGCSVIPNVSIQEWTTIGAGSVVIHSLEKEIYAKGTPAKSYKKKEKLT